MRAERGFADAGHRCSLDLEVDLAGRRLASAHVARHSEVTLVDSARQHVFTYYIHYFISALFHDVRHCRRVRPDGAAPPGVEGPTTPTNALSEKDQCVRALLQSVVGVPRA